MKPLSVKLAGVVCTLDPDSLVWSCDDSPTEQALNAMAERQLATMPTAIPSPALAIFWRVVADFSPAEYRLDYEPESLERDDLIF